MKCALYYSCLLLVFIVFTFTSSASETVLHVDFSEDGAQANGIFVMSPGFGTQPGAEIEYGDIPIDDLSKETTNGRGAVITAEPGEGLMLLTPRVSTTKAGVISCYIHADGPETSATIAAVGASSDQFISVNTPNNGALFANGYQKLMTLFTPAGDGFQALLQVINTSSTRTLTIYIDNLMVHTINEDEYYSGAFLSGGPTNFSNISIKPRPSDLDPTPTPMPPSETLTLNFEMAVEDPDSPFFDSPIPMKFTWIEPGTYMRGSPADLNIFNNELPQHQVTITKGFYIGTYEVTNAQFAQFLSEEGGLSEEMEIRYDFDTSDIDRDLRAIDIDGNWVAKTGNENEPITHTTWYGARDFARWAGKKLANYDGRLPTEAEWEYACRAGTTTRFYYGNCIALSDCNHNAYTWSSNNTHTGIPGPRDVATKIPNPWGLFDMHGNAMEWVNDWYGTYTASAKIDPPGPVSGDYKVLRGGSWDDLPPFSHAAIRYFESPERPSEKYGFRVVLEPRTD